jgi:hypothetical protein
MAVLGHYSQEFRAGAQFTVAPPQHFLYFRLTDEGRVLALQFQQ